MIEATGRQWVGLSGAVSSSHLCWLWVSSAEVAGKRWEHPRGGAYQRLWEGARSQSRRGDIPHSWSLAGKRSSCRPAIPMSWAAWISLCTTSCLPSLQLSTLWPSPPCPIYRCPPLATGKAEAVDGMPHLNPLPLNPQTGEKKKKSQTIFFLKRNIVSNKTYMTSRCNL